MWQEGLRNPLQRRSERGHHFRALKRGRKKSPMTHGDTWRRGFIRTAMYHRFPHVLWPERARIPCGTYATADKCGVGTRGPRGALSFLRPQLFQYVTGLWIREGNSRLRAAWYFFCARSKPLAGRGEVAGRHVAGLVGGAPRRQMGRVIHHRP